MDKQDRTNQLLDTALQLAQESHYKQVRLTAIAERAGVTHPLVSKYLGTMTNIRRDIMRRAIERANLVVLAQGLDARERVALKAPEALRLRAQAMQAKLQAVVEAA